MHIEIPCKVVIDMGGGTAVTAIVLIILIVFCGFGGWNNTVVHYNFDKEIGDYFENSDRASTAVEKLGYFNQFLAAVEREGLTSGQTSIFWQRPVGDLANAYKVALSLQARLEQLSQMDPMTSEYQFGMNQVTTNEYCWFPLSTFYQGYALMHGAWGDAITPASDVDRCHTND